MSCPVNLGALPSGVLEEILTPENIRGRISVSSLTPLSFPKSRTALWDGTPMGEMLHLSLCSHRAPQLSLSEKALRLAQRHARHNKQPRVLCFFLGSVSVDSDEEGITVTLDRFDPGRDQAGSSGRVPSALLPGDVLVPCWFSSPNETKPEDAIIQSEADLHLCFKALQQFLCSRQTLELCHLIKVKGQVSCSQRLDATGFSLSWSAVCPSVGVDVQSVRAVPIIPTALLRNLTSVGRPHAPSRQRGFLTMDQSRKLLLVLESDPKASNLPLVGLWLSGVTHVCSPQVWACCLRFLFSSSLQDRVFSESGSFLLVIFASTHRVPQFFQCRGPGAGPGPQLDYQLLSASQFITLYQVAPVDGQTVRCELSSESHSRQAEVFREAQLSFSRAAWSAAGLSISDQDSGVEDEDLSPRPSPSPHLPAQQTRRVEPSVPELSLLIDSSFSPSHNGQLDSAHRPPPPTGYVTKTTPPPGTVASKSPALRTPLQVHSTPNSNLQQPCNCCSNTCSSITPSPHPHHPQQPAPRPILDHHTPPSNLHTAQPPASKTISPLKPSSLHQTPAPTDLHAAPPPSLHTPPPLSSQHKSSSRPSSQHQTPQSPTLLQSNRHDASPAFTHLHHPPSSLQKSMAPASVPPPPPSFLHQTPPASSCQNSPGCNHHTPPPASSQQLVSPFLTHPSPPAHCYTPSCPCRFHPPPPTPLPRYIDSPSPHPGGAGDPTTPSWPPLPYCGEKKCCAHAPGGAIPSDAYQLLLQQDRQLRLLQAQVQMLLDTQKKLQSSSQQADTQMPKSTTSVAVETGASLFWGNPVPNVPHQDAHGPLPLPASPIPTQCSPQDLSVTRSVGGADNIVADQVTPQLTSDPHSLSGLQSPVLGESVSMYRPADQQQSFYQNLLTQLNSRLQEPESQQEAPQEASRRLSVSTTPDASHCTSTTSSSSSTAAKTAASKRKPQRRSAAGDPVVSATLNQLQQLGVQVNQDELTASDRSRVKAVESASTLASIDPAAAVSRLCVSKPSASVVLSGGSVDLSLEANTIALRYLSDSQLSKLSAGGPAHLHGPALSSDSLLSPSNMSLATRRYMRRYGLIEEEEEDEEDSGESKKEQEAVGVQEATARQPLTDTLNVKLLPQSQLIRDLRPKMQLLAGSDKENRAGRRPSLTGATSHETEGSVGNILDLSRLRQLPKLF